jgi:hypothetical protein
VPGVTATLAAVSAGVTVTDATAFYGDVAAGQSVSTNDTFAISVATTLANGETVYLKLTMTDSSQNEWESTLGLQVTTPVLACGLLRVEDQTAGNGNGIPEPGETVTVLLCIENQGLATARNVTASLSSADAFLDVTMSTCQFGTLLPGAKGTDSFDITIAGACPAPRFPTVSAAIADDDGYRFERSLALTIGRTGFFDDVESNAALWSLAGEGNLWHRCSHRAHEGSFSWYCGVEGQWSYPKNSTSVLLSVPFSLGRDPVLSFWTWYDVALYGTTGLYAEVSDGSQWEKLDFIGSGGALKPLLMGQDWVEYTYDLSRYPPGTSMQLRFRFVSDSEAVREGVYVDDIKVSSGRQTSEVAMFIRGDANADGAVTIADPIFLLSYLFSTGGGPACFDAADPNDDSGIDLSDVICQLMHLFGGQTFDPPLGVCGSDATSDGLDCQSAPSCR